MAGEGAEHLVPVLPGPCQYHPLGTWGQLTLDDGKVRKIENKFRVAVEGVEAVPKNPAGEEPNHDPTEFGKHWHNAVR